VAEVARPIFFNFLLKSTQIPDGSVVGIERPKNTIKGAEEDALHHAPTPGVSLEQGYRRRRHACPSIEGEFLVRARGVAPRESSGNHGFRLGRRHFRNEVETMGNVTGQLDRVGGGELNISEISECLSTRTQLRRGGAPTHWIGERDPNQLGLVRTGRKEDSEIRGVFRAEPKLMYLGHMDRTKARVSTVELSEQPTERYTELNCLRPG